MKTLRFIMFILYRYYSKGGTKNIPYFSALCAVVLLIYLHIFQILILLNQVENLLPFRKGDTKGEMYWKMALFFLPIFLIVALLVKPNDLKELHYDERKIKRGGIYLIIYAVISFVLLFVLAFGFSERWGWWGRP